MRLPKLNKTNHIKKVYTYKGEGGGVRLYRSHPPLTAFLHTSQILYFGVDAAEAEGRKDEEEHQNLLLSIIVKMRGNLIVLMIKSAFSNH